MTTNRWKPATALTLALALFLSYSLSPAMAAAEAKLNGRVLDADGVTPRAGVTVTLVDSETKREYASAPTDATGNFVIESAPVGTYMLLAVTDEGAFLAAESMELEAGDNTPLALSLARSSGAELPAGLAQQSSGGLATWAKWVIVGVIAVAAILVIDDVSGSDDEPPASPI